MKTAPQQPKVSQKMKNYLGAEFQHVTERDAVKIYWQRK